ncbi:MAG TPA: hypothetical protein VJX67_00385, partial [Blastocatellia bacterium]|nr:hypothetical protein [Blastocatellia bacterium]
PAPEPKAPTAQREPLSVQQPAPPASEFQEPPVVPPPAQQKPVAVQQSVPLAPVNKVQPVRPAGTAELIASLLSGIDAAFGVDPEPDEAEKVAPPPVTAVPEPPQASFGYETVAPQGDFGFEAAPHQVDFGFESSFGNEEVEQAPSSPVPVEKEVAAPIPAAPVAEKTPTTGRREDDLDAELREMLEDLKGNTGELKPVLDYETHYSLGLAYKDMDLLDEAIEQFQLAFRIATLGGPDTSYIQCCHMLGFCFKRKEMSKVAIMWFQRGLKVPNRSEDEYQAIRFEIGLCYEELGDVDKAIEIFTEVYGIDVNYRHVTAKLKELQASKNA